MAGQGLGHRERREAWISGWKRHFERLAAELRGLCSIDGEAEA
jgi:hypothetical protein